MPPRVEEPFGFWRLPASIERNKFKFKSLSCWAFNISVGCSHGCRFCYVPSISANKQKPELKLYGVADPDADWGDYSLLRQWDEGHFLKSLLRAENTPSESLNRDGNRAVIFCSTTDPYQIYSASTSEKTQLLQKAARHMVRRSLELILERSTINVRILTRSPLARTDFDLYKKFGDRLLFGMSLPTLDNQLAKIYEPHAPAPSKRLQTLQAARDAGLNVFVAVAPTYPECDETDLRRTLSEVAKVNPVTIFHEPINMRAENVQRIEEHAKEIGQSMRSEVFRTKGTWARYAFESFKTVERLAHEMGLIDRLHLWPDQILAQEKTFLNSLKAASTEERNPRTPHEEERWKKGQEPACATCKAWVDQWHRRISEWPRDR